MKGVKYIAAVTGVVVGAMTCAAGRIILNFIGFPTVVIITVLISNFVLNTIDSNLESWIYWVALVAAIVGGVFLAWLSTRNAKAGPTVLAMWTGF